MKKFHAALLMTLFAVSSAASAAEDKPLTSPKFGFSANRLAKKLMKATLADNHAAMKKLFAKGADPNLPLKSVRYNTPLGRCFWGHNSCSDRTIRLLLEHGADPRKLAYRKKRGWESKTAVEEAARWGRLDLVDTFLGMNPPKASALKAHTLLYTCLNSRPSGTCEYFKAPNDLKRTRFHLEQAAALVGDDAPPYGNYYSDPRERLANDIASAFGTWRSISYHKELIKVWTPEEALPYCERGVDWLKPYADKNNERDCKNPHRFAVCDDDSGRKSGTGSAYGTIRRFLDGCLTYTKDDAQWKRLLARRMEFYSLNSDAEDGKNWILRHAEARYKNLGDPESATYYANLRVESERHAAALKRNVWGPRRRGQTAAARRWIAARERQKLERVAYAAERQRQHKQREAAERAESRAQGASDYAAALRKARQGDDFDNKLERIKQRTLGNIERTRAAPVKTAVPAPRPVAFKPNPRLTPAARQDPYAADRAACLAQNRKWLGDRCDSKINKITFPGRACSDPTGKTCKTGETVDYDPKTGTYVARNSAAPKSATSTSGDTTANLTCAPPYANYVPGVHGFNLLQGGSVAAGGPYCEHFSPRKTDNRCDGHKSRHAEDFKLRGKKHCEVILGGKSYTGTQFVECNCGINDAGNPQCRIAYRHSCG